MNKQVQTLLGALESAKESLQDQEYKEAIEFLRVKNNGSILYDVEITYSRCELSTEQYLDLNETSEIVEEPHRYRSNYIIRPVLMYEKYTSVKVDPEIFQVIDDPDGNDSGVFEVDWEVLTDFVFRPNGVERPMDTNSKRIFEAVSRTNDVRIYVDTDSVQLKLTKLR